KLATVSLTVVNTTPLPDVIVTSVSYADGIFTSTVTNQGTAATPVGTVIGVGYSVNGNFRTWGAVAGPLAVGASVTIGTNGGPYIIPNGTHTIMADVDDVNRFTESNETNNQLSQPVIVDGGTSPTVSITAPTGGVNVAGSSVTISASAADDIGVSGVQFMLDGANLGAEVTTPPYAVTWDSTAVADGPHIITAVARDADGNTATSAGVSVTVANTMLLPDVIVTSISYADGIFTSTVTNQGAAATPVGTVIGVGYSVNGNFRTWGAVAGPLAVGASVTIGTKGGPYIIPNGTHTIMADVDDVNRFTESNETNNQLSQLVSVP
ncbi:Ig-like domain-containing protein, partial [Nitrosomonas sp.]|uniref:Ig-like domain-containing protein n=1 Tax=Nitrosomonas sp. TaxID=42353 RepID=UPI002730CC10